MWRSEGQPPSEHASRATWVGWVEARLFYEPKVAALQLENFEVSRIAEELVQELTSRIQLRGTLVEL